MFDEDTFAFDDDIDTTEEASDSYSRIGMTLYLACCSYADKGGSLDEFRAITDRVMAEYWGRRAPRSEGGEAAASLPESEGLSVHASPSSPEIRGGEGHYNSARKGHADRADPAPEPMKPRPKPKPPRGLDAILSVQATMKRGLMWIKKTRDGRPWAAVGWNELGSLDADGAIAREIKRRVNAPVDHFAKLHSAMTDQEFEEAYDAATKATA